MKREQATNEHYRDLFINITVVVVFISLMLSLIFYLNNGSTNIKRLALENLAGQFSASAINAHWQWQGEGRPQMVILSTYNNRLGVDNTLVETDSKLIFMSDRGWPKVEPTAEGCANIWNKLLNMSMYIDGVKVFAEYYDGLKLSNNILDSACRYRLSTGPFFEYKVFSGQVLKVKE
jgi:hypothetical protein